MDNKKEILVLKVPNHYTKDVFEKMTEITKKLYNEGYVIFFIPTNDEEMSLFSVREHPDLKTVQDIQSLMEDLREKFLNENK